MKLIKLTERDLSKVMHGGRGIKKAQAITLGIPWPLKSGWKEAVIGKTIDSATFDLCCDLKPKMNSHQSMGMAGLIQDKKPQRPKKQRRKKVAAASNPIDSVSFDFTISTDGGCWPNNGLGNGGWACVIRSHSGVHEFSGFEVGTTNNRMELMAILNGLRGTHEGASVLVRTDSQYCLNACSLWYRGWAAKGWKTATGDPVKNREVIEEIVALARARAVSWKWVRGHNGDPDNERCDELASAMVNHAKNAAA